MAYELIIGEPRAVAQRLNNNKDFIPFLTDFIDDSDKLFVIGQTRPDIVTAWPTSFEVRNNVDIALATNPYANEWASKKQTVEAHGLYLTRTGAKALVFLKKVDAPDNMNNGGGSKPLADSKIKVEDNVVTIEGFTDWPETGKVWIRAMGSVNGDENGYEYFEYPNMAAAVAGFSYEREGFSWGVSVSTLRYQISPSGGNGADTFEMDIDDTYPREGYVNTVNGENYQPNGGYGNFDNITIQGPFRELKAALDKLEGDEVKMFNITVLRQNKLQFFVLEAGTPNDDPVGDS